jgi:hypothetical protein
MFEPGLLLLADKFETMQLRFQAVNGDPMRLLELSKANTHNAMSNLFIILRPHNRVMLYSRVYPRKKLRFKFQQED